MRHKAAQLARQPHLGPVLRVWAALRELLDTNAVPPLCALAHSEPIAGPNELCSLLCAHCCTLCRLLCVRCKYTLLPPHPCFLTASPFFRGV